MTRKQLDALHEARMWLVTIGGLMVMIPEAREDAIKVGQWAYKKTKNVFNKIGGRK